MRIGDAAAAAGTTPRALRFYEENGLLPLELGLTVADVRLAADRLDLLDSDQLPRQGEACAGTAGIVQHRIAALDAEIGRLTQLRNQLAARIVPAQRAELAS
jgi:MerR family copper efflux transcriptional regulator